MTLSKRVLLLVAGIGAIILANGSYAEDAPESAEPISTESTESASESDDSVQGQEREEASDKRSAQTWLIVDIGIIGTASEDIFSHALADAQEAGFAGILIRLDTPGGALENTRAMVKAMMAAPLPIVVWVGPSGSRAGSAGAFITIAGHIAVMAPGTNIGAAHPVQASGQEVDGNEMKRKIVNDTVAFIESIARKRGRNVDMARSFVATSVSITAEEALEHKVIDLLAEDVDDIFEKINGREVTLQSGAQLKLNTTHVTTVAYEQSFRQKMLSILSNPNLFYLLFMAGLVGIGYELTHPGMLFPGVFGAICMILALIATSVLPVSYGAAALILVGVGLLVAEAFVPSFGILGIGGFIAFVLGSVFLVDPENTQGLRVSLYTIAPGALTTGLAFLGLGYLIVRSDRAPVKSGREGMVGQAAVVISDFIDGRGRVRAAGSIWQAEAPPGAELPAGCEVTIEKVEGLLLKVK